MNNKKNMAVFMLLLVFCFSFLVGVLVSPYFLNSSKDISEKSFKSEIITNFNVYRGYSEDGYTLILNNQKQSLLDNDVIGSVNFNGNVKSIKYNDNKLLLDNFVLSELSEETSTSVLLLNDTIYVNQLDDSDGSTINFSMFNKDLNKKILPFDHLNDSFAAILLKNVYINTNMNEILYGYCYTNYDYNQTYVTYNYDLNTGKHIVVDTKQNTMCDQQVA